MNGSVMQVIGVEIDMVVQDSVKALRLYERIFDLAPIEVTDFSIGQNEVVFTLYGVRFHMLDENPEFDLMAPKPDDPKPIWFNIMVEDIKETYERAMEAGCQEVQPVTEIADHGVSNAIFSDPFGYLWMLHEIHEYVGFDDRVKLWEERED